MNEVVMGLLPAFVAGLAVQQILELGDSALGGIEIDKKGFLLSLASLVIGLALASFAGIRVLAPIVGEAAPVWADVLVTGLIVSGGTESFNSILKFLGHAKEKAEVEKKEKEAELEITKAEATRAERLALGNGDPALAGRTKD